ncbi:MAG TPA: nucleoside triphosphate pyrophosphohydrolase [Candidatus Baltobacteraceae bacterium]|jgi:predicted house-cleaning noncanonical NTP pyrophosphatase (MazG superfamily)|nr:nucleoside triphosphate pyrophosphohydrolase [Candidatus Baltobacteraceae bacterium]
MKYDKLVRDRIPEIIEARGGKASFRPCADDEEYLVRLVAKLREEVDEFDRDRNAEELADVLEVVRALCLKLGLDPAAVEALRVKKAEERGAFEKRLILESAE